MARYKLVLTDEEQGSELERWDFEAEENIHTLLDVEVINQAVINHQQQEYERLNLYIFRDALFSMVKDAVADELPDPDDLRAVIGNRDMLDTVFPHDHHIGFQIVDLDNSLIVVSIQRYGRIDQSMRYMMDENPI